MNAFSQPDGIGTHLFHGAACLLPKCHGNRAGNITAEAIDILRPVAQRIDLILPQTAVFIIKVYHIGPVAHLVAAGAVRLVVEEIRVLRHQRRIG